MATMTTAVTIGRTAARATCAPSGAAPMPIEDAQSLALTCKALADPNRVRLLALVAASPGREACICDLTEPIGLTQPTVSHHMRQLTEAGLVTREQRGKWAYFRLVPSVLEDLSKRLGEIADAPPAARATGRVGDTA